MERTVAFNLWPHGTPSWAFTIHAGTQISAQQKKANEDRGLEMWALDTQVVEAKAVFRPGAPLRAIMPSPGANSRAALDRPQSTLQGHSSSFQEGSHHFFGLNAKQRLNLCR